MVSQGVPMILGGDEFLRTQRGNNNAWCQDNPTSWVDWTLKERNAAFFRFVKLLIAFRKAHPVLRRRTFFTGARAGCRRKLSGMVSSPPGPTSRTAAAFSLSPSTAGALTGPTSSTTISTWR